MPSRAELELWAAAAGVDASSYQNDSTLEQKIIYELKRSGAAAGVKATGTLTSDATAPSNNDTVTVGSKTYTFKTALTEAKATGTLTSDATAPADGDTVTIGSTVYTFKDTLTDPAVPYEVLVGVSAATALDNLKSAINATAGAGTTYGTGTVAHPSVSATTNTDTTQVVEALAIGTAGNAIASTEASDHLSWGAATLTGGANAVANQVLIGASAAAALDNLKSATNASAGEGTTYSTGTTAHTQVTATTNTNTTQVFEAVEEGGASNAIATTEVGTHTEFGAETLTGGATDEYAPSAGTLAAISGGANV